MLPNKRYHYLHFFLFLSSIRSFTGLTGVETGEVSDRYTGLALLLPSNSILIALDSYVAGRPVHWSTRYTVPLALIAHGQIFTKDLLTQRFHRSSPVIVDYRSYCNHHNHQCCSLSAQSTPQEVQDFDHDVGNDYPEDTTTKVLKLYILPSSQHFTYSMLQFQFFWSLYLHFWYCSMHL